MSDQVRRFEVAVILGPWQVNRNVSCIIEQQLRCLPSHSGFGLTWNGIHGRLETSHCCMNTHWAVGQSRHVL